MSAPRGLSAEEARVWAKLAATVTPMAGKVPPAMVERVRLQAGAVAPAMPARPAPAAARNLPLDPAALQRVPRNGEERAGLDASWDRRLRTGSIAPDLTLDLHGHALDAAYDRLMDGMAQARAMGARVVLLVTGKPRPVDPADRAERRGAIRAKILDWLAASSHHAAIAAIRPAHLRHGGAGALYVVLKRPRQAA